jgi:coenzyme F420-dependent glucose-6-phosphate dehydrogenase
MSRFTWHASHEQFPPGQLLDLAQQAEDAGFDGIFSSDHLQPWLPTQGQAGFLWTWLGAALARTSRTTFGAITVPGGWRYHPVIAAQAIATAASMFPGRLPWIALGSGEAVNEVPLGNSWPAKAERDRRLREGIAIIRRLLRGEEVEHHGVLDAAGARVWSLPEIPPALIGAALSAGTAEWLGSCADGLLTAGIDPKLLRPVAEAFRGGGGSGKPIHLKVDVSYAASAEDALRNAYREWRIVALDRETKADLVSPEQFRQRTETVTLEEVSSKVIVSNQPDHFVARLRELSEMGFETIDIHNVGPNQAEFIAVFGRHVLPALR